MVGILCRRCQGRHTVQVVPWWACCAGGAMVGILCRRCHGGHTVVGAMLGILLWVSWYVIAGSATVRVMS